MNEKPKKAAPLKYSQNDGFATIISAAGKGSVAEEIIKRAQENNIPIIEDPSLVEILAELNINTQILEDLFQVVAEVFASIYQN